MNVVTKEGRALTTRLQIDIIRKATIRTLKPLLLVIKDVSTKIPRESKKHCIQHDKCNV